MVPAPWGRWQAPAQGARPFCEGAQSAVLLFAVQFRFRACALPHCGCALDLPPHSRAAHCGASQGPGSGLGIFPRLACACEVPYSDVSEDCPACDSLHCGPGHWRGAQWGAEWRCSKRVPPGIRTHDLRLPSPASTPLGHRADVLSSVRARASEVRLRRFPARPLERRRPGGARAGR